MKYFEIILLREKKTNFQLENNFYVIIVTSRLTCGNLPVTSTTNRASGQPIEGSPASYIVGQACQSAGNVHTSFSTTKMEDTNQWPKCMDAYMHKYEIEYKY